jgi:ubiquinone/menaquinone biosynthesis C-methylase UbiE
MTEIEKERLTNKVKLPNWVYKEHEARYNFSSAYIENKIVIDCACGSGAGTFIFSQSKPKTIKAFDVSADAIEEAKIKCQGKGEIDFQISSALKLPLSTEYANTYISLETIEHLQDADAFLKEVARVLKTSGMFICSTPNRVVTNPGKALRDRPANKFHLREYSKDEFELLLKKYFSHVDLYGQNPNSKFKTKFLEFFGKFLPFHLATRAHQGVKLILSIIHKKDTSYHSVQKTKAAFEYELLTAVCQK